MPMRDNASCCRPRLYDENDPDRDDDVDLVLRALDEIQTQAMATGDKSDVEHASDLKRRIINSAGESYEDWMGDGASEAES